MSIPFIQAKNHGGVQNEIRRLVMHGTVSPCVRGGALNVAHDFHTTTRDASAHYVTDPGMTVQCLTERTVGYHAPPNRFSLGFEMCDMQSGAGSRWHDGNHEAMLRRTAALVRARAEVWRIPLVKLSPADLRAGKRGICGHSDVTAAWHLTDHTDPGAAFPWSYFMSLVKGSINPTPVIEEDPLINLKLGDKGELVQAFQEMIRAGGQGTYLDAHGGSDGNYGAGTAEAFRRLRVSVGSLQAKEKGQGDSVNGWGYAQLHTAVARNQADKDLIPV